VKVLKVVFSEVLESAVVGYCTRLQQTPRAVTAEPPSLTTLPEIDAVVDVIAEAAEVVITGKTDKVVVIS